jgi:hypothetical protein
VLIRLKLNERDLQKSLCKRLLARLVEDLPDELRSAGRLSQVRFLSVNGTNCTGGVFQKSILVLPNNQQEFQRELTSIRLILNASDVETIAVNVAIYPTFDSTETFYDRILADLGHDALVQAEKCIASRAHSQQTALSVES